MKFTTVIALFSASVAATTKDGRPTPFQTAVDDFQDCPLSCWKGAIKSVKCPKNNDFECVCKAEADNHKFISSAKGCIANACKVGVYERFGVVLDDLCSNWTTNNSNSYDVALAQVYLDDRLKSIEPSKFTSEATAMGLNIGILGMISYMVLAF